MNWLKSGIGENILQYPENLGAQKKSERHKKRISDEVLAIETQCQYSSHESSKRKKLKLTKQTSYETFKS